MANQTKKPNKVLLVAYKRLPSGEIKLLLLKTAPEPWRSYVWYVVTGGIENDETIEMAAQRELFEETGIKEIKKLITKPVYYVYQDQRSNTKAIEQVVIIEVEGTDKITLNNEHTDCRWVNKSDFVELIDWYGDKSELKNLLKDI